MISLVGLAIPAVECSRRKADEAAREDRGAGCPQARVSVGGAPRPKEEAASRSLPAFSSPSYAISRASHRSHPFSPSCASSHRTPTSASEEEEDRV